MNIQAKTQIPNITLITQDESYQQYMAVQWKLERIKRVARMSYKCKLAAMVASDNRKGKLWS